MNVRLHSVGFGVAIVVLMGCGGESASTPPPEYPAPSATSEAATTPADKPTGADAADAQKPAPESTASATATSSAPKDSSDKPTSDKPTSDKPAEKAAVSDVPGANISVGRFEADGLVTKSIECKSEGSGGGLGLLGAVLVTAWMSPQKKALDACAGQETETRVVWKARGGKVTEIEAKGDAKVKACVEKALRPGKPAFDGHCAATVVHGKK